KDRRALDLAVVRPARVVPASGNDMLDDALHRAELLVTAGHLARATEDDGGAVVHGVVVDRAGEHEPVEERHRDTDVDSLLRSPEHAAPRRAVNVQRVAVA